MNSIKDPSVNLLGTEYFGAQEVDIFLYKNIFYLKRNCVLRYFLGVTDIHTYIHTHIHTYIHTYIHTHKVRAD
jgi:hypothetical protein